MDEAEGNILVLICQRAVDRGDSIQLLRVFPQINLNYSPHLDLFISLLNKPIISFATKNQIICFRHLETHWQLWCWINRGFPLLSSLLPLMSRSIVPDRTSTSSWDLTARLSEVDKPLVKHNFFFFLALLLSMWDLSSLIRDRSPLALEAQS